MKKTLTIGLIALAGLAAACGGVVGEAAADTVATTQAPVTTEAPTTTHARVTTTEASDEVSTETAYELGEAICTAVEGNVPLPTIVQTGIENTAMSTSDMLVLTSIAVVSFCPSYQDALIIDIVGEYPSLAGEVSDRLIEIGS